MILINTMFYRIVVALLLAMLVMPVQAGQGLDYRFARLWPALQQPWYFGRAGCVAEDESGNVYVPDGQNDLLRKFSRDGSLISQWGNQGSEAERLNEPQCVVLGPDNLLYVSGAEHVRIYNTDGEFQRWLGGFGVDCPGRFNNPSTVGFDSQQRPDTTIG